MKCQNYS